MTLIAATVPDVVLLLEQIKTSPVTWYAAIDRATAFSPRSTMKERKKQLLSTAKTSNTHTLSYCRDTSVLEPYIII